jgi:hypothetical protein
LIESHPVNISTIARCYDLKPRTLFEWYKNDISDYYPDRASGRYAGQKVYEVDRETGEIRKEQVIHIFQPGHVGERMCIDEKMIGKRSYTIFSNHESGYIALMIESIRPVPVKEALLLFGRELLDKVRHITADMSHSMKNICEAVLPQVPIIIDKFHVPKPKILTVKFNASSPIILESETETSFFICRSIFLQHLKIRFSRLFSFFFCSLRFFP